MSDQMKNESIIIPAVGDKTVLAPIKMGEELMKLKVAYIRIKDRIDYLRGELLNETKRLDVETLKTGKYIIIRVKKKYIKVNDKKALEEDLKKWDVEIVRSIDLDYMRPVIEKIVKDGNDLAGVESNDIEYVTVKLNKGVKDEKISG